VCSRDGYRDSKDPEELKRGGYLYKVYIPVYQNRSIETIGTVFDQNMMPLHRFVVRAKGQNQDSGAPRNLFTTNGNTPTGLMAFDLNTPMDDPVDYGPYPINRVALGLKGNAQLLMGEQLGTSPIRSGILMHTGQWKGWDTSKPMPDSYGCLHAHPADIEKIWHILVDKLGVQLRQNTNGKLPYPYKPQGLLSVEQLD
jgi:hypothetical protein